MRHTIKRRALLLAGLGAAWRPAAAAADTLFEGRPVRFVLPFPPASGADISARYFAERLSALYGLNVTVENRPGGNGIIGVQAVLGAPADGRTVFIGSQSQYAANVALLKKLPYDPVRDFAPLGTMLRGTFVVIVPAASPAHDMAGLLAMAKAAPAGLNVADATSSYRLVTQYFANLTGTRLNSVPYKGGAESASAVAAGNVDLAFIDVAAGLALIAAGRIRALAVAADERDAALPAVPTLAEAGFREFRAFPWSGAAVPSATPPAIVARWGEMIRNIGILPATREAFRQSSSLPLPGGPQEMKALIAEELVRWKTVAAAAGIEPE